MWYNESNEILFGLALLQIAQTVNRYWIGVSTMDTLPHYASNDNPVYVYRLVDPRDEQTFYVGISADLYERFKQHMRCDGTNLQKDQRIQEILKAGHVPLIRTVERTENFEQALECEAAWIKTFLDAGIPLLNIAVACMLKNPATLKNPTLVQGRPGRTSSDKDHAYNVWLLQTYGDLIHDVWRNKEKFTSYVNHHPPKLIFSPEDGFRSNPKKSRRKRLAKG
jgi:predicted GIY-YIG superfamily endonuclease